MSDDEIVGAKAVEPYVLEVSFSDGMRGRVDVEPNLWGEMFEPLRDPGLFMQARFDPDFGTVVWPNGADLSPEFLVESARATKA